MANTELSPLFQIKMGQTDAPLTVLVGANASALSRLTPSTTSDVTVAITASVGAFRAITQEGEYCNATVNELSRYAGVTKVAYIDGDVASVVRSGLMTEATWTFNVDEPIFIGSNGILTQTPGAIPLRRIGWAMSATQIVFDPFPIIGA